MIVALFPAVTENDVSVELTEEGVRLCAELRSATREYTIHEWKYGGDERFVETPEGFRLQRRGLPCQRTARRASNRSRNFTEKKKFGAASCPSSFQPAHENSRNPTRCGLHPAFDGVAHLSGAAGFKHHRGRRRL